MHKLLLADDSVTIQRVIELTFSGEDIQVIAVNDGEQAIARILAERPDIVLADIGMPKKGGYDVAAFVKGRSEFEHIPVLLLAGAFEPVDQARAEQVRCDGVLIKPFEPRQVIERVRELLEGMKSSPAQAAPSPVVAAAPADAPSTIIETDLVLDEYFESLNAAFDSVGPNPPASVVDAPPDPPRMDAPRRRGDSLDEYFDRLSNAFEQARPADAPPTPPDGFDDFFEPQRVPTVEAIVGSSKAPENGGANGHANGHVNGAVAGLNGHERGRNPIVEALEAMLGRPEPLLSQPSLPGLPELPEFNASGNGADLSGENLADAVTERVLERLLPEITATVQRLVREEVDRLQRH